MSTECADSGYISNGFSPVRDGSQLSLNDDWELIASNCRSSCPCSVELRSYKDCGVEGRDLQETDISLERRRNRASNVSGTIYAAPQGKGSRPLRPASSGDRSETHYRLPMALFHDLHSTRSHLQIALQRDMDSRKHSFASIQHLSSVLVQLAQQRSTDQSVVDLLYNKCLEDSADLAERYNDVLKAGEAFEGCLRKLADYEDHMSETSSTAPSIVERYFELAGEEGVVDDRLTELEAEHHDAFTASQEGRISFGQPMQELSPGAEDIYRQKRQELIDARGIARGQVQLQREICLSQGINPERYRYRRMTAPSHKRLSARDILQSLQKSGSEVAHDNVTPWLQHSESA